jgi:hypothetical protein
MFMKRRFAFLWVAFATLGTLSGCIPDIRSNPTSEAALVKVECRDAPVRQILQILRSGYGKDISTVTDGSCLHITAAFSAENTPPEKLLEIMRELNDLKGVLRVEVEENPHPIRQNF